MRIKATVFLTGEIEVDSREELIKNLREDVTIIGEFDKFKSFVITEEIE